MNNLPINFPSDTPCWFCNKNIQNHSGAWRTERKLNFTKTIKLSCFRHEPNNDIVYRWIEDNENWKLTSIIINYESYILYTAMSVFNPNGLIKDGDGIIYERKSNGDINKIARLTPYWIFQFSLDLINKKLITYSILS